MQASQGRGRLPAQLVDERQYAQCSMELAILKTGHLAELILKI